MRDDWEFEWDPAKSEANTRKHGISFELARDMWDDPFYLEAHLASEPEDRWAVIARLPFGVYTAIITFRGESTIRIISVRRASKREEEAYGSH